MLVFAAITPHPPLLIPNIGKEETKKVEKTRLAYEKLEQDLYLAKPDIIFIISPHGSYFSDAFTVNAHTNFITNFKEFGDLETKKEWNGDPKIASDIDCLQNKIDMPIRMISQEELDHGSAVPLFFITEHLPNIKILPIGYSELSSKKHLDFGYMLKDIIMNTDKRIAVIASGDLSHGLSEDDPAGFTPVGKEFDTKLIELLETRNTAGIINLDEKFVEEAAQCGYRSILILLGVIKNMDYQFKNYSYEAPFGVGYLVGNFVL